jgi:hypothetical protein
MVGACVLRIGRATSRPRRYQTEPTKGFVGSPGGTSFRQAHASMARFGPEVNNPFVPEVNKRRILMNLTIERGKIGARSRQSERGLRLGLLGLACLAAVSVSASAQTFIEFNAPGANTAPATGTFPLSNNIAGQIVGYFSNNGFVGTAGGTITSFDVSGAACCTVPESINSAGVIAGDYEDANGAHHGFVRAADGTITSFDAPNAGTNAGQGTFPESINTAGVIAGYCHCEGEHGFVRAADGTITNFEAPGASGTFAFSINTGGAIAGYWADNGSPHPVYHGFVRSASGTITSFDAAGAGTSENSVYVQGTFVLSINDDGVITGYYVDASEGYHGFVRAADGTITTLNAPGAGTGLSPNTQDPLGTKALSINDDGVITGYYIDPNEVYHGFMVSASGAITTFNAPGAGTQGDEGTYPRSINDNGVIVGYYSDFGDVYHGFQLTP